MEDFLCGGVDVDFDVGGVVELLWYLGVGGLFDDFFCVFDCVFYVFFVWG